MRCLKWSGTPASWAPPAPGARGASTEQASAPQPPGCFSFRNTPPVLKTSFFRFRSSLQTSGPLSSHDRLAVGSCRFGSDGPSSLCNLCCPASTALITVLQWGLGSRPGPAAPLVVRGGEESLSLPAGVGMLLLPCPDV